MRPFLEKEKPALTHALNKHKVALINSQKAPEGETIACRATVSALGALER